MLSKSQLLAGPLKPAFGLSVEPACGCEARKQTNDFIEEVVMRQNGRYSGAFELPLEVSLSPLQFHA